jgi:sodium transport system permease protein
MTGKTVGIIFRKEFLDILRDRKTLIFMIALPLLLIPALMTAITRIAIRGQQTARRTPLIVQCETDGRDRFLALLRTGAHRYEAQFDITLTLLGPDVRGKVDALAKDLGISRQDVLLGLNSDARVRAHPRVPELRAALATAQPEVQKKLRGGGADKPLPAELTSVGVKGWNDDALHDLRRLSDLLSPLTTLDFRTAAEVDALPPGPRASAPDADLPSSVRGDAQRRAAALAITSQRIHARLRVPTVLDDKIVDGVDTVGIEVEWDSTWPLSDEAHRRLGDAITEAAHSVREARLAKADLPSSFVTPVEMTEQNVSPPEKEALNVVGGFLPYILILMCFLGGNFPASDLGAGEKERLTLETLLVTPTSRVEIAAAKFLVVFCCSMTAAVLATGSLAYTFQSGLMSPELAAGLKLDLRATTIALALLLVVPLAAVFSAILLSLSIYAKSFKEASTYMAPVQMLIIIPSALSMIPTFQLDRVTAWIPVVNVTLGLREVLTLGGKAAPWTELAITVGSSLLLAVLALKFCANRFSREDVLFRS